MRFIKNILITASGGITASFVTLSCTPIITRLFSPDELGFYGVFTSILAILIPVSILCFQHAIVLPKRDSEAVSIMKLCFIVCFLNVLILSVFYQLLSQFTELFHSFAPNQSIFFILGIVTFISGAGQLVFKQLTIRQGLYLSLAKINIIASIVTNSLKVAIGILSPTAIWLILVQVIGSILHTVLLFQISIKNTSLLDNWIIEQKLWIKNKFRKYAEYPIYRTPQTFINILLHNSPILIITYIYGVAEGGFYLLVKNTIGFTCTFLGRTFYDVYFPWLNKKFNKREDIFSHLIWVTIIFSLVGIFPTIIISLFGSEIYTFLFGESWSMAGLYAEVLVWFFYLNFVNNPIIAAVPILRINKHLLIYEIASGLAKIIAFYFSWMNQFDALSTLTLFTCVGGFSYAILILWVLFHSSNVSTRS